MSPTPSNDQKIQQNLARFVGVCLAFGALSLCPPLFDRYLSVAPLLPSETSSLWWVCLALAGCSGAMLLLSKRVNARWSMLLFSLVFLVGIEQLTRVYMHYLGAAETRDKLWQTAYVTYPDHAAYQGHPFLAFTGRPAAALHGNEAIGALSPFNNYGFVGDDFHPEKQEGTIRIACLGGSTTASGYPAIMETWMNESKTADVPEIEVLNFGITYWTTAHSMVNYLLNVQDFEPDYVVIHHAWNDEKVRGTPAQEFRGDYSHAFKSFQQAPIPDKYPLRISLVYRLLQDGYGAIAPWQMLEPATTKERERVDPYYDNPAELAPFKRNLQTIIEMATLRGSKVVLTTQPHSTNDEMPIFWTHQAIDQHNTVTRELAATFADELIYVDLDDQMTGKMNEVFKDVGHVNDAGKAYKAAQIGQAILLHASMSATPPLSSDTLQPMLTNN